MDTKMIIGVFNSPHEAIEVIRELEMDSNFDKGDISLIAPDLAARDLETTASATPMTGTSEQNYYGLDSLLGSVNTYDLPAVGRVIASGPLSDRISYYDSSDTVTPGRLVRALNDVGIPDSDAHLFAESVRRGSLLVALDCDDRYVDQASSIFQRHGAMDLDMRGDAYRKEGFESFDETAAPYGRDEMIAERERFSPGGDFTIPVVEESINVGKRKVNLGGVRVISRVIEQPVDREIELRDEHFDVERRRVDRPVNASDMDAFKEGEMTLSETREEAVVNKEARVTEEVKVHKDVNVHTENVHDTVRRTEVRVEKSKDRDLPRT